MEIIFKEAIDANSYIALITCSHAAKAFDYESLCKNLEQLSNFEKRTNCRVIESGLLKGIHLEDIKKAGERLVLQDGCREFFQKVIKIKEKVNVDCHILSYCWCADLIRSAFSSGKFFSLCFPCDFGEPLVKICFLIFFVLDLMLSEKK